MAIDSYETLKTELATRLHRTDLTSYIPTFITFAEARIYRDLRIRCMETALSSTIASGVIAVPTGYLELKNAYIDGSTAWSLTRKTAEWIYRNYPTRSADNKPEYIGIEADNFIFGPYPDSAYTVKGIYYKKLDALSDSNTTNWFITNAPDLLFYAALIEAGEHTFDDALVAKSEARYTQIKDRIQRQNDAEEFSGSPISVSVA